MTELFVWGCFAHAVADWFFQNDWMAKNKTSLFHPAAWVHSAIHMVALSFVFPVMLAVPLGLLHALIDTRTPLQFWRKAFRQTTEGPAAIHVAFWQDQVAHAICIALAAALAGAR